MGKQLIILLLHLSLFSSDLKVLIAYSICARSLRIPGFYKRLLSQLSIPTLGKGIGRKAVQVLIMQISRALGNIGLEPARLTSPNCQISLNSSLKHPLYPSSLQQSHSLCYNGVLTRTYLRPAEHPACPRPPPRLHSPSFRPSICAPLQESELR